MGNVLGANQYGKAENRVVRIVRDTARHEIRDLNVSTALRGGFDAAYLDGDQSAVLPTDTQKNMAFAYAKQHGVASPEAFVVLLCGSREEVRGSLAARFAGAPRVRVLGFIDRMPELLAAADVLIHSTAGLTVMEALVAGCSVISYGWGRGHIRANNRAFALHGMAQVARDRAELRTALRVALAAPAGRDRSFASLPTAAQLVLERFAP